METKVCGGTGYVVEDFRTSFDHGDTWIGVPVQCYMECNTFIPWINTDTSLSRSLAWSEFIPLALSPTLVLFTIWEAAESFPEPFLHFDDLSVFSGAQLSGCVSIHFACITTSKLDQACSTNGSSHHSGDKALSPFGLLSI